MEEPLPYNPNEIQPKLPIVPHALKNSLLLAGILIIVEMMFFIAGSPASGFLTFASALVITGMLTWTSLNFRNKIAGGYITYGKIFLYGFLVILFASVIRSLFLALYYQWIAPDLPDLMYQKSMEALEKLKSYFGEEKVEKMIADSKSSFTPVRLAISGAFNMLLGGSIVSLIVAAFAKKEKPILPPL